MEKKEFIFDEDKLIREREKFIEWIKVSLGREVKTSSIKIYCSEDGKFNLQYSEWNHLDQFIINRLCYPNSSVDTKIEINSKNYNISINKK
jgi:hypothetical protein